MEQYHGTTIISVRRITSYNVCYTKLLRDASLPVAPALPQGFSLTRLDFDLRGICADCGKETNR